MISVGGDTTRFPDHMLGFVFSELTTTASKRKRIFVLLVLASLQVWCTRKPERRKYETLISVTFRDTVGFKIHWNNDLIASFVLRFTVSG